MQNRQVIVVAGEALIDLAPTPDGGAFVPHAGGGPFNTAIALGRLATPVAYLGRLSTDGFGRLLRQRLVDDGVDLRLAVDTADPTTLALVTLSDAGEASYSFYTDGTSGCGLRTDQLPARLPDEVEAIHFGSLGIVLEPGASGLEALVERERGRRLLSLDPNVRPAIIPDMEVYRHRLERLVARVDMVRLSTDDVALLGDASPAALAERWLAAGAALIVVTAGREGSVAYRAGGEVSARAEPVDGGRHHRRRRLVQRRPAHLAPPPRGARPRRYRGVERRRRGRGSHLRRPGGRRDLRPARRRPAPPDRPGTLMSVLSPWWCGIRTVGATKPEG